MSQTGEPYIILVSGGIKQDGDRFPVLCATVDIAVFLWLVAATYYCEGKLGTLYWRVRPELNSVLVTLNGRIEERHVIYSRLLVSEKPMVNS